MKRQLAKGMRLLFANEQRLDLALSVIGIVCLICAAIGVLVIGN